MRWISACDDEHIADGGLIAVICIIVFDLGAVFTGITGRAIFPGLTDQETILPVMTSALLPAIFTGVFLVVVLAASISTVDSLLILVSSAVARDVVQKVFRPRMDDHRVARIGRIVTVVIGTAAVVFALREVRVIFWFVLFAWSGLASAFAPVVLLSLFWKRTTRAGARAGMISGFLTATLWVVLVKTHVLDLYALIPGFGVGLLVTIAVSLITTPPSGAAEEFDEIHRHIRGRDVFTERA